MSKFDSPWTDDRVELLKKLWAEGLSASRVAKKMGGVTRSGVIGKIHRLGLSGNRTTHNARHRRAETRIGLSEEQQAHLRRLWDADVAVPVIAKKLGMKNEQSVYYYAKRLGLAPRLAKPALDVAAIGEVRPSNPTPPAAIPSAPRTVADTFGTRDAVLALADEKCKWPIGEVGTEGFHFCQRAVVMPGTSYCSDHFRDAHEKYKGRTRETFTWRNARQSA